MSEDVFTSRLMDILNREGGCISAGEAPDAPGSERVAYGIADEDETVTWKYPYWSRWLNLYEQWRRGCEPGMPG